MKRYSLFAQIVWSFLAVFLTACGGSSGGSSDTPDNGNAYFKLDTTFGTGGIVTYDGGKTDWATNNTLQADGKIIVSGGSNSFSNNSTYNIALWRYNTDGTLDNTFGATGVAVYGNAVSEAAFGLELQGDGKILAAGESQVKGNIILLRYNADGTLDNTYGTAGMATYSSVTNDRTYNMAIQADGKAIVLGSAMSDIFLYRFKTDGTIDTTFGTGGAVIYDGGFSEYPGSIAVQTDGKIIVAGGSGSPNSNSLLLRYNTNGTLDNAFGIAGVINHDNGGIEQIEGVVIQTDGKILTVGVTDNNLMILRFNSDGTLDNTFGTAGIVVNNVCGTCDPDSMALQTDGKIIVMGTRGTRIFLLRYNSDGTLDNTFYNNGQIIYGSGPIVTYGWGGVSIQTDGKIIIVGSTNYVAGVSSDILLLRYK